jgi:hypothetical protein
MSSLRLESFVYTVESFRQMKTRLAQGGMLCFNHISSRPWMKARIYRTMTEAFGTPPRVLKSLQSPFDSVAFVYAPEEYFRRDLLPLAPPVVAVHESWMNEPAIVATDDWPHLYLSKNRVPPLLLALLLAMLAASTLIVIRVEPSVRKPNLHFFFLGAGFMLLETRSITQMALLFGATWNVNTIVFAAVLFTIFISNYLARFRLQPKQTTSYVLLIVSLILGYFFPFGYLLTLDLLPRVTGATLVIGLPIIWASFIFSTSFAEEREVSRVFGSNLLGIVLGGSLEYMSIIWGLNMLYGIAIILYLCSFLFLPKQVQG